MGSLFGKSVYNSYEDRSGIIVNFVKTMIRNGARKEPKDLK